MVELFPPDAGDKSIVYLGTIFGNMNGLLPTSEGTPGIQIGLLSTMFSTFNNLVLGVAAIIVLYVTVVGIMKTAHEGEFMGKQWHSLWIPIRIVLGIAALVPMSAGFSALQILMMWVIVQGVGVADRVWDTAWTYVNLAGSPYNTVTLPSSGVSLNLGNLFQALVCDTAAQQQYSNPVGEAQTGNYYCAATGSYCGKTTFDPETAGGSFSLGPNGSCGTFNYCNTSSACKDSTSLSCAACNAQIKTLKTIIPILQQGAAALFVQADYNYRDFYYNSYNQPNNSNWNWIYTQCQNQNISKSQCCVRSPNPSIPGQTCLVGASLPQPDNSNGSGPSNEAVNKFIGPYVSTQYPNLINTLSNQYMVDISAEYAAYLAKGGSSSQTAPPGGWITSGSFYYQIAVKNGSTLNSALPALSMDISNPNSDTKNSMYGYRNDYNAAAVLANAANNTQSESAGGGTGGGGGSSSGSSSSSSSGSSGGSSGGILSPISNAINSFMFSIMQSFMDSLVNKGGGSPLVGLQMWGQLVLLAVEILFPILLAITFVLGMLGYLDAFVLGTGIVDPAGPTITLMYFLIVPPLFALLATLVAIGGLFAVYVPLIPYVVFTMGAIGWLLSVLEAMVAGPLVALGLLSPGGQSEVFGKAEPAIMLLFNIFLRPSLMIFGLMASMLLAVVVVTMINDAFSQVMGGIMGLSGSTGDVITTFTLGLGNILEYIILLVAYVFFVVSALNKCFAAIYIIPENVMRWIGGQGERYGEEAALGEVKKGTEAGAAKIGGGIESARTTSETATEKRHAGQTAGRKVSDKAKHAGLSVKEYQAGKGKKEE